MPLQSAAITEGCLASMGAVIVWRRHCTELPS